MTIVFHTHLAMDFPEHMKSFAAQWPSHQILVARNSEEKRSMIKEAHILVDHRVDESLLHHASSLRWILVPFAGVDSLPLDLLNRQGIRVACSHGNAPLVAEKALALALAAMGRLHEFDEGLRQGKWHRQKGLVKPFALWTSLRDKKVCILGAGAVACALAQLLTVFTSNIVGFRRQSDRPRPAGFARITHRLDEAMAHAALCVITLPETSETRSLVGMEQLRLMQGGCLVNVGRGSVVHEADLYEALHTGVLSSAGLDVWYRYPRPFHGKAHPSAYPFHELSNVILSPHAASHTTEGKIGQLEGVFENIQGIILHGRPSHVVRDGY